jgi:formamidopyrimidine-DNA glycosylase
MIELPEAVTISRQFNKVLSGRRIFNVERGNTPHKFAFYTHSPEEYQSILNGRVLGASTADGSFIVTDMGNGFCLLLGEGGERINYHPTEKTLPKKHQFLMAFEDGGYLTVTVQGWGAIQLYHKSELHKHPYMGKKGPSPQSENFSEIYFEGLFRQLKSGDKGSVKFFLISQPGVSGLGNGCLQDILFKAKIHPRRTAASLSANERQALYRAICGVIGQMTQLGGRNSERDLFNCPGGYQRILNSEMVGRPCPVCSASIEKINFMGGAAYYCPRCQPL